MGIINEDAVRYHISDDNEVVDIKGMKSMCVPFKGKYMKIYMPNDYPDEVANLISGTIVHRYDSDMEVE